ncbi:MAG: hypothetical protein P4L46_20315 [Fimbriimonas sp.]|nr:hypothetical protein [Fimbriimonas sp.]
MSLTLLHILTLASLAVPFTQVKAETYRGPRLTVKPVFFVPKDASIPASDVGERFMRQMKIAQARYFELLGGLDTFQLAPKMTVVRSKTTIAELEKQPSGAAEFVVKELMAHDHVDRWSCPYVYVAFFVGTGDYPGGGGGRPINGGHNNGGGIIILSASLMDSVPNAQSTLQHELGHAFGLPHVDVYGYDMIGNDSIMSYNPKHHSDFFHQSPNPGNLIPEDMRGLAQNKWAFPNYRFNTKADVPANYTMRSDVTLGPMGLSTH